jgi:hypothetical protein
MQVVIAEHRNRSPAQAADQSQHIQGAWTAIDEVSGKPDLVYLRIESQPVEHLAQFVVTALDVADCVNRH